jgi:hypothetical protein
MKFTTSEESADFITLDTEKLFSKFKSHELSKKYRPNHYAFLLVRLLLLVLMLMVMMLTSSTPLPHLL